MSLHGLNKNSYRVVSISNTNNMVLENDSPVHSVWKNDLYKMQLSAPVPIPVKCSDCSINKPDYLGIDYHGAISHIDANNLLNSRLNGAYLVRTSRSANGDFYTLSLKFNDKIHHYKLYYDTDFGFYVRDKKYDCVRSLVADGLITMYLQLKVPLTLQRLSTANYQESPYMTLNKRKLRALSKECARNINFQTPINSALSQSPTNLVPSVKLEKPHSFKITTFKGLNWCELCGNYLWGFTAQGVKCDDCGMAVHNKCSEKIPNHCIPDLKNIRGVFGIELTTLLYDNDDRLPFVVTKCVTEIESRGLQVEGIYRLSGYQDEIDAVKTSLDKDGESADISEEKCPNINVITGALKLYLRVLPIPLITFIVHPLLINALVHKDTFYKVKSIQAALKSLPKPHYNTLKYMLEHLKRVSQRSNVNKMTAHNLATVFAPTLISLPESSNCIIPDLSNDILLIELLITESSVLLNI